jgi:hypothetical protein
MCHPILRKLCPALVPLVFAFTLPHAQAQSPDHPPPPKIDFANALGIDAKKAQAVDKVLREQHEKRRALDIERHAAREKKEALRRETDRKLAAILSADQLKKLHELMPRPPHPDGPPPPRRE